MKYIDFKKSIDKPYFSALDIKLRGLLVYPYQLSLWKKEGLLFSFKRGLYYFPENKNILTSEIIAYALYSPSYISLEGAFRLYGFIPEMVYAQTCVTPKTTRKFSNEFGNFSYRHIRSEVFFGYQMISFGSLKYALADPEKAILDYFYLNENIRGEDDFLALRFNKEEIVEKIKVKKLRLYAKQFKNIRLDKIVDLFIKQYL